MTKSLDTYNTTGMKCSLTGVKCPGRGIQDKGWGCPHWCVITVNEEKQIKTYTGCGVLMIPEIQLTISRNSNRVAASVQSYRNDICEEISEGMNGVKEAILINEKEKNKALYGTDSR